MSVAAPNSSNLNLVTNLTADEVKAVQNILVESANTIAKTILLDLMRDFQQSPSIKEFARTHTISNLDTLLETTEGNSNKIHKKLYEMTEEHIEKNVSHVAKVLNQIFIDYKEIGSKAKTDFLGSYVYRQMNAIMPTLLSKHAKAIEDKDIWKTQAEIAEETKPKES